MEGVAAVHVEPPAPLAAVRAPAPLDPLFAPPSVFGPPRDGRFGANVAWLREGPEVGGFVAAMIGGADGDPARAAEISAQRYSALGALIGSEISVGRLADPDEAPAPALAALENGCFAAAWSDPAAPDGVFHFRLFGADGVAASPTALAVGAGDDWSGRGAARPRCLSRFADGCCVVTWSVAGDAPDDAGAAFVAIVDADGALVSGPEQTPAAACAAVLRDDRFVCAWSAPELGGGATLDAPPERVVVAIGDVAGGLGPGVEVGDGAAAGGPAVVGLSDGGFAVVWRGDGSDGVRGRRFDAAGGPVAGLFFLPRGAIDAIEWGEIAYLELAEDDRLLAVWSEDGHRVAQPVRMMPAAIAPSWR